MGWTSALSMGDDFELNTINIFIKKQKQTFLNETLSTHAKMALYITNDTAI